MNLFLLACIPSRILLTIYSTKLSKEKLQQLGAKIRRVPSSA